MQAVYLLLRNNSQNGPYHLNELLQFGLTPYDLIWIEGKSAGWYYPQEIEALRPHLSFLQKPASPSAEVFTQATSVKAETPGPQKIFVSMPSTAVAREEPKQETATRPSFNVGPTAPVFANPIQPEVAEVKTTAAKSPGEAETDDKAGPSQKRPAKKPLFSKSGVIVLCLLSVALYATWRLANKPATEEVKAPVPQAIAEVPAASASLENNATEKQPSKAGLPLTKKENRRKDVGSNKNTASIAPKPLKANPPEAAVSNPVKEDEKAQPAPVVKEESKTSADDKKEPATTTETPKKKKLRDKILDIFRKKPEEKPEEAKPVENENGGRQSTRREAGSSLAQMVAVKFDIPNDWMMGIKGARATLTNKASETIVKAVVEIRYYNDDNDLLDKKTVAFTNIKSKSTQTVSVPDHATATRLEYSVVSAVGAEPLAMK